VGKSQLVISVSGVRGLVFDPLSPEVCSRFAAAFANMLGGGTYVVGRDTRPSGEILEMAVISGIRAAGGSVIAVGISPTPTIQLAVEHHRAKGGIAVTASHNPAEWNAMKLISGAGTFLEKQDVERITEVFRSGISCYAAFDGAGKLSDDKDAGRRHMDKVLGIRFLDASAIAARRFRVAVDCINGAASVVIPEMLETRLGCEVFPIACEPSGVFKRSPEPLPENLAELSEVIRAKNADIGFAFDPDGDRLALADEKGNPIGEDYTLAICADTVLKRAKGPVVTNLSTSMAVEDIARRHGVNLYRTPIGEANVVAKMKAVGSIVGGEGNGGVILPEVHYGRDALVGTALALQALLESGTIFSEMMVNYPQYVIVKQKVSFDKMPDFDRITALVGERFPGARFNLEDGVRVDSDRGWLHIRKSGTEPVIRFIAEARDRAQALALIDEAKSVIGH
jgi:phosphomannomutase